MKNKERHWFSINENIHPDQKWSLIGYTTERGIFGFGFSSLKECLEFIETLDKEASTVIKEEESECIQQRNLLKSALP